MTTTKTLPEEIEEVLGWLSESGPLLPTMDEKIGMLRARIARALSSPEDAREKALEEAARWFEAEAGRAPESRYAWAGNGYEIAARVRALASPSRSPETTPAEAEARARHLYQGACPDEVNGWASRDPACPACRWLDRAAPETTEGPAPTCGNCGTIQEDGSGCPLAFVKVPGGFCCNRWTLDPECSPAPSGEGTAAEKLIRDNVDHLAAKRGVKLRTRRATLEELPSLLRAKLKEEVEEYLENPCDEEWADIEEVLDALAKVSPHTGRRDAEAVRDQKRKERGGFIDNVVLITNDAPPASRCPECGHIEGACGPRCRCYATGCAPASDESPTSKEGDR